jgi:predicted MFS family arabinose efflux permease
MVMRARVPTGLLFAAGFIVSADIRVLSPLLPAVADDFSVSIGVAGLAVGVYALAYAIGQLLYGPLGDRVGKVRVIRGTLSFFAVGTAVCALAPTFPVLLGLRLITGLCAAGVIPMVLAYLGDEIPDYALRRRSIGLFLSAIITGQVFGQALGGILAGFLGWRVIFIVLGGVAGCIAAGIWRHPIDTSGAAEKRAAAGLETGPRAGFPAAFRTDRPLYLLTMMETFIYLGAFSFAGASLVEDSGASYPLVGSLLALFAGGSIIASRYLHQIALAEQDSSRVAVGAIGGGLSFALLATLPGPWLFGAAVFLLGLSMTFAHSTLQTRATEVSPTGRGTAVSLFAAAANLGAALGTFASGGIVDSFGFTTLFAAAALGMFAFAMTAKAGLQPRWPVPDSSPP